MGGGSSKEEFEERRAATENPVNGLKTGDVVTVRGELFAGSAKHMRISFEIDNGSAMIYKVIPLHNEDVYNKVKIFRRSGDELKNGIEVNNVIFLNRHFDIEFKCCDDKFEISVYGKHFCDYNHHVPPDRIKSINLSGDADWKPVELPQHAKYMMQTNVPDNFPTREEVKQFLRNLRQAPHFAFLTNNLPENTDRENAEQLAEFIKKGLEATNKFLKEDSTFSLANIAKYAGYMGSVFGAAVGVYNFAQILVNLGKPSGMEQIMNELNEIKEEIKKLEATVERGFAELMKQQDMQYFKENVTVPLGVIFDLYQRCFTVTGTLSTKEFIEECQKQTPRNIFSRMSTLLSSEDNVIESSYKTKKYVYSVTEEWTARIHSYAVKLLTVNMFYYGILAEEHRAGKDETPLIDKEDEIADLVEQVKLLRGRLANIEEARGRKFHTGGYAKEFIREKFKSVKHNRIGPNDLMDKGILPTIAHQLKNSWKDINGPADCMFMAVRGGVGRGVNQHAGWTVSDPSKVTVAENIGSVSEYLEDDHVCIVLIQPVTQEMRDHNEKANSEYKLALKDVVASAQGSDYRMPVDALKKIGSSLSSLPYTPLLILYNLNDTECDHSYNTDLQIREIAYEMGCEAWSSPGGPFPLKYWRCEGEGSTRYHRMVQVIYQ